MMFRKLFSRIPYDPSDVAGVLRCTERVVLPSHPGSLQTGCRAIGVRQKPSCGEEELETRYGHFLEHFPSLTAIRALLRELALYPVAAVGARPVQGHRLALLAAVLLALISHEDSSGG